MMLWKRMALSVALVACLGFVLGCEDSGDDGGGGGGGAASGSFAGTWVGRVCGRTMVMTLSQNGTSLSGSYTLADPVFGENVSGSVSSEVPPATATLNGGGGRQFQLTFNSYSALSGGYFKSGVQVCGVTANK